MITALTDSQLDKLKDYRDKWIDIGLSTTPVTLERAIEIIHPLQTELLGRKATPVVVMDSPLHAWIAVCWLAKVNNQVWKQVVDQVRHQMWDQVWDQVQDQVMDQMKNQVEGQVRDQVRSFIWPWIIGQWESSLFSFYDFFLSETQINISDELRRKFDIWKATTELGIVYPLEHVAVVCQKPKAIHKNEHGLHREGGMAVEYEGWGLYSLNGVRVPEYLAITPSEKLDINWYHSQENADIKAEFIRKYGVERMLSLGKKIDSYENYNEEWWTKSEYELWDMESLFPNLDYQPYLKMMNQTTKIWHVEAVSPNCRTLRDAIKERFGGRDFTIKAIA